MVKKQIRHLYRNGLRQRLMLLMLCTSLVTCGGASPSFQGLNEVAGSTVGGSGRNSSPPKTRIVTVTSTADDGTPGTLRSCMEGAGARVCVFEVGGVFRIRKAIVVKSPFLTVAGQTAPATGVTIEGGGVTLATHDVILKHLTIRVGDDPIGPKPGERDGITIGLKDGDTWNVLIDHVSISWALDENIGALGGIRSIKISNCIIAEGLSNSIHPKGPHSKALLIGEEGRNVVIEGNLIEHNGERIPFIKSGSSVQFLNNLIYGWGDLHRAAMFDVTDTSNGKLADQLDVAGNYYLRAPYSSSFAPIFGKPVNPKTRIFVYKNFGPTRSDKSAPEWNIAGIEPVYQAAEPFFKDTRVLATDPAITMNNVLKNAGACPKRRSEVDLRLISEVTSNSGSMKDCIAGCDRSVGGWPSISESRHTLDLPFDPMNDQDGDGLTELDDWLTKKEDSCL